MKRKFKLLSHIEAMRKDTLIFFIKTALLLKLIMLLSSSMFKVSRKFSKSRQWDANFLIKTV